eukprot:m.378415 g.378415  ORF g.378415 m.378415 type:complete len:363 (-) comp28216_c0_seq4:2038-3126(-)
MPLATRFRGAGGGFQPAPHQPRVPDRSPQIASMTPATRAVVSFCGTNCKAHILTAASPISGPMAQSLRGRPLGGSLSTLCFTAMRRINPSGRRPLHSWRGPCGTRRQSHRAQPALDRPIRGRLRGRRGLAATCTTRLSGVATFKVRGKRWRRRLRSDSTCSSSTPTGIRTLLGLGVGTGRRWANSSCGGFNSPFSLALYGCTEIARRTSHSSSPSSSSATPHTRQGVRSSRGCTAPPTSRPSAGCRLLSRSARRCSRISPSRLNSSRPRGNRSCDRCGTTSQTMRLSRRSRISLCLVQTTWWHQCSHRARPAGPSSFPGKREQISCTRTTSPGRCTTLASTTSRWGRSARFRCSRSAEAGRP